MKKKKRKADLACGTRMAFEAHLRRKERPCPLCLPFTDTYDDDELIALRQEISDKTREQTLWDKYSITLATFQRIFIAQDSRCACCKSRNSGNASWSVDHDHGTGKIRGILCSSCNSGIGLLGDQLPGIRQAEAYLLAHAERGGHPKDLVPPPRREVIPKISKRMRRCFHYLSRGVPSGKIVILMRLEPKTIKDLEVLWIQRGRPFIEDPEHVLKISKDPLRFGCECGFESPVLGPGRIQEAIERVNDHIDTRTAAEAAQISTGPLTEQERLECVNQERSWTTEQEVLRNAVQERLKAAEQESLDDLNKERAAAIERRRQADKERDPALRKLEEICFQFLDNHDGDRDALSDALLAAKPTQQESIHIGEKHAELKKMRARVVHRVRMESSRLECACGYVVAFDATDEDSVAAAAERMNVHFRDRLKVGDS